MARTTSYAESTGDSTTTSTTYQTKVTNTFTPDASTDYWMIFSALLNASNTSEDIKVRFRDNTGGTDLSEVNLEQHDTTDFYSFFGLKKYTSSSSPVSTDFVVQYAAETGATITIRKARAIAIKSNAADQYNESDAESTTTSGSPQTKTTLSFTPATSGDYLIIAYAETAATSTTQYTQVKLVVSGTDYGSQDRYVSDTTSYVPWATVVKLNLAASSQSLTIQYLSSSGVNTAKIRNARILALRLDAWPSSQYAESRSRSTTTSSSYQDKTTLSFTPAAVKHIVFGCGIEDSGSVATSGYAQLLEDATSIAEQIVEPQNNAGEWPYFHFYQKTLSAASTTWKTQYKAETSDTTGFQESAIAVLQVEDAGGTTYDNALSIGMCAGASTSAVAVQAASVSLDLRQGLALVAGRVAEDTCAIGIRQGLSLSAAWTLSGEISLGVRQGLSAQAAWLFASTISLNTLQGLSYATSQTMGNSVSFLLPVDCTPTGNLTMSQSGAFGVRAGLSFIGGLNFNDSFALGTRVGLSEAGSITYTTAISLDSRVGEAVSVILTQAPTITIGAMLGYTHSNNLVMSATLPMVTLQGLAVTGGFILDNTFALGARVGYTDAAAVTAGAAITLGNRVGVSLSVTLVLDTKTPIDTTLGLDPDVTLNLAAASAFRTGQGLSETALINEIASVSFGTRLGEQIAAGLNISDSISIPVRVGINYGSAVDSSTQVSTYGQLTLMVSKVSSLTPGFSGASLINRVTPVYTMTSTETTLP